MTRKDFRAWEMQVGDLLIKNERDDPARADEMFLILEVSRVDFVSTSVYIRLYNITTNFREVTDRSWDADRQMHFKWTLVKLSDPLDPS